MRSAISDVMYCVGLCMERCVQFGEHIKDQAVGMLQRIVCKFNSI